MIVLGKNGSMETLLLHLTPFFEPTCRRCGYDVDQDGYCSTCSFQNPVTQREGPARNDKGVREPLQNGA